MRALYAWLTILGALVVGILIGNFLVRATGPAIQLAIACQFLAEAQNGGHLDAKKRGDLLDRMSQSPALSNNDKADAIKLKTECPKL